MMHFNLNDNCTHSYSLDGTSLESVNEDKDLGLLKLANEIAWSIENKERNKTKIQE